MDPAGARELAKRIAEEEQRRTGAAGEPEAGEPSRDGSGTHVLFISHTTGYQLLSREGQVPGAGSEISLNEHGGGRYRVSKVGPSPLPNDPRRCAFLESLDEPAH
jgi:hypothetical protein